MTASLSALLARYGPLAPSVSAKPASNESAAGMFEFLDECHQQMQHQLAALRTLVRAIESEGLTPKLRAQARSVSKWFNNEARQHHLDEERHIFPALLASDDADITLAAGRLIQDHGWLETDWMEIEPALAAAADGYTWFDPVVLRHSAEVFEQLYLDHIVLEETLAYPAARSRIPEGDLRAMGIEMARRRAIREAASAPQH
jgi:hemerythrin-like domain-containing protein